MSEHEASVVTGEEAVSEIQGDETATEVVAGDSVVELEIDTVADTAAEAGAEPGMADASPEKPARRARKPRTARTEGDEAVETTAVSIDLDDPALPAATTPFALRVEAAILLADRPISDARLAEVLGLVPTATRGARDDGDESDAGAGDSSALAARRREAVRLVREAIDELNRQYADTQRTFRIESVSGGRQMLTIAAFGSIMARMKGARAQTRLSQAALETLAIVGYRQPILRAQLEAIRGVACGEVLKSLMERRLVKIVGRAEEVGRPMLYGTTPEFLRVFGLANLSDLPQSKDLR